jgi:hypothetical protein
LSIDLGIPVQVDAADVIAWIIWSRIRGLLIGNLRRYIIAPDDHVRNVSGDESLTEPETGVQSMRVYTLE